MSESRDSGDEAAVLTDRSNRERDSHRRREVLEAMVKAWLLTSQV